MYNRNLTGNNTNSQWNPLLWSGGSRKGTAGTYDKRNTYPPLGVDISSPKEAPRSAEAAFLGASAMFKGFKIGILGCCQVLPNKTSVFIRVSEFSFTPYDTCFIAVSTDIYYVFYTKILNSTSTKIYFQFL